MLLECLLEPMPPCLSSRLHIVEVRKQLQHNSVLVVVDEITGKARGMVHPLTALNLKNGRADNALLPLPTYALRENPFVIHRQLGDSSLDFFLVEDYGGQFRGLVSLSRLRKFCQGAWAASRAADEHERLHTEELRQLVQDPLLCFDLKGRLLWQTREAMSQLRPWRLQPQELGDLAPRDALQLQKGEYQLQAQGQAIPLFLQLFTLDCAPFKLFGRLRGLDLPGQPSGAVNLVQTCAEVAEELSRHLEYLKNLETVMQHPQSMNESIDSFLQRQSQIMANLGRLAHQWRLKLTQALPQKGSEHTVYFDESSTPARQEP